MSAQIPGTDKKYLQANTTDQYGNVYITKNISFRKKGYMKLASRVVAIASEKLDANFQLPLSFGRSQGGFFRIATAAKNYLANIAAASYAVVTDPGANAPTNLADSTGRWYESIWHVSTATKVWWKSNANGNWADTALTLTSGYVHDLEVFRSRGTLCITDGNVVQQVDSSYTKTNQFDLTIPADYEITEISFNSDRMGVATKVADAAAGQNQNAFFFVWDGKATSPNGSYDTGSDMIVCCIPYKSQWLLITRTGQALPFNGSGFDDPIFTLPYFFRNILWGDNINRQAIADCFTVEGDRVFINLPTSLNTYGKKTQTYIDNYPGGVLCYDPEVGLHNNYAPSASMAYKLIVAQADVNTSTGEFAESGGTTIPETGSPVKYVDTSAPLITGLTANTVYYIIKVSSTSFKLATSKQDAIDMQNIIIPTSQGNSLNNFIAVDIVDYGVVYSPGRSGGVCLVNEHKNTYDHLIFGAELPDFTGSTNYGFCNITIPGFRNIGYIVSPRLNSSQVTDMVNKLLAKFEPLDTDDKIIVKFKNKSVINFPITTPQTNGNSCVWVDNKTFTITTDLSSVVDYLSLNDENECEVEIISGAGAGQLSQIADITDNAGVYTIILEDEIEAAIVGRTCNIKIDNFKTISFADVSDTLEYKDFTVDRDAKWTMFKLILDGVDITLEEQNIISKVETPVE